MEFNYTESKNGLPIIEAIVEGKPILLHSKYDPIKEAERIIESFKDKIESADHILFYGAGMGYVVRAFFERYPNKLASVYEPFEEVANLCMQNKAKSKFPSEYLNNYVVEIAEKTMEESLLVFEGAMQHRFEIIVLPSYERWQTENLKKFIEAFKKQVDNKQVNVVASNIFSRRWTINALMNLPKTFEHPNLLVEKKKYFEGKPVLLVSAGPSLSEEIDNIKKIKENGLAYILAVGSANKALVQEGILPDAVCTYDPQSHNHTVFKELYERGIDTVPMIYGSTVGFETLEFYQGPKLYFPTSQDGLTTNFHNDKQIVVNDATTIAIVTLQLLTIMEVSKIILVGQNFAFKKNQFYAKGINRYDKEKKEVTDNSIQKDDLIKTFEVKDVQGDQVLTNSSFNRMKENMEIYLKQITIPVINTTNGGAAIEGTTYLSLQQLLEKELLEKVVVDDWWKTTLSEKSSPLDKAYMKKYSKAFEQFVQQDKELEKHLNDFQHSLENLKVSQIQRRLEKFDELFQKYHQNTFYLTTILPIAQIAFEKLKAETQLIRTMGASKEKAKKVIQVYNVYRANCRAIYRDVAPIVASRTLPALQEQTGMGSYVSTSGIFHYVGKWEKKYHTLIENIESAPSIYTVGVETKEKNSTITFKFCGTTLKIFGTIHSQKALKLQIEIDEKVNIITINNRYEEDKYGSFMHQKLLEVFDLEEKIHDVKITILSNNPFFVFEGIEIYSTGRAYHIDEVMSVEELEIGKRIRCRYEASYNTVGKFSNLGNETTVFLPVNSCPNPNGDFYFIMVDESEGKKKLIADRVVQNYVSWRRITSGLKCKNKPENQLKISLPTGNNIFGRETDCEKVLSIDNAYINQNKNKIMWNYDSNSSTWIKGTMWCDIKDKIQYVGFRGSNIGTSEVDFKTLYIRREDTIGEHVGFRPALTL
ncbi:DUF115 domain-containing protein [Psychrobacillus sp. PGGUH221]|uniref:motility associated factor glycosyltransferase family protein n=1 Tax=Psychrobacillus sp. PGGUH221 TaxID=3020058 RepID=UPI0035C66D5E